MTRNGGSQFGACLVLPDTRAHTKTPCSPPRPPLTATPSLRFPAANPSSKTTCHPILLCFAKGGCNKKTMKGGVSVSFRLSTFAHVFLRFRLCVCLCLLAFARVCLRPPFVAPLCVTLILVSHHCCGACRATQCRAHSFAANSGTLRKGPPFHGS